MTILSSSKPSLTVILPVYNEENTVRAIIAELAKVTHLIDQLVIVDDGSTDQSLQMIKQALAVSGDTVKDVDERLGGYISYNGSKRDKAGRSGKNKLVRMTASANCLTVEDVCSEGLPALQLASKTKIISQRNGGKGSAVRAGLAEATGEYVLIQDADLEYSPADIELLLAPLARSQVQVVFGSRFLGPHSNLLFWHRVGNAFLNFLVNILFDSTLSDMETCYKLIPTKLLRELKLQANGFELEPEITCKLLKRKVRIFEVPISYVGRDFSEGKKITWRDGITALKTIISLRLWG